MAGPQRNGSRIPARVVGIGASAGGVQPIIDLLATLPQDLDAAVPVILHMAPTAPSALPVIPARHTRFAVEIAVDRTKLDGHHPRIAPPCRSIARFWGPRGVVVVSNGALDDGASRHPLRFGCRVGRSWTEESRATAGAGG